MKIRHMRGAGEFREVITSGEKIKGKKLSLYVGRIRDGETPAVGVVVPKRFAKLAVKRNHIRRLIYSYFRENGGPCENKKKVVVRLQSSVAEKKRRSLSEVIRNELASLAEKAKN